MTTQKNFRDKCLSVNKYARKHKLNRTTLSLVLSGKLKGSNRSLVGNTKRVIEQLKKDEIWIEPLQE